MKISIIMPTYNEVNTIENNLVNYCSYFEEHKEDYEIIVSCNGCIDGTVKVVKKFANSNPNVKCIIFLEKTGKGRAIIEGFKVAEGEIIGFVDADDAYNHKDVIAIINSLKSCDCGLVMASKWKGVKFKDVQGLFFRKFVGRVWNRIVRLFFNLNYEDTQGGAKFVKKDALNDVINNLNCDGFEFDVELLWRLKRKGYSIKEVYTYSNSSDETSVIIKDFFSMFFNILKVRIGVANEK